jgi:hypothetical protein
MTQLSFIPALEASRAAQTSSQSYVKVSRAMTVPHRPTAAQVTYLKKLTRIKSDIGIARYVARKLGKPGPERSSEPLTRHDFSQVIDAEVAERRLAG